MEEDGFQIYKCKKGRSKSKGTFSFSNNTLTQFSLIEKISIETIQDFLIRLQQCKEELRKDYYQQFVGYFNESPFSEINEIVCFGIGCFTRSIVSLTQLALLLMFHQDLQLQKPIIVYDICFNQFEKTILTLKEFPFKYLNENTKCHYSIDDGSQTLFFLPHLDYELVQNVLTSNRDHLDRIILYCNNLSQIFTDSRKGIERFPFIVSLYDQHGKYHYHRIAIENNFRLKDVFNDIDLFWFKSNDRQ